MNKSLEELALLVGGKIKGDERIIIKGVAKVEDVKEGEKRGEKLAGWLAEGKDGKIEEKVCVGG